MRLRQSGGAQRRADTCVQGEGWQFQWTAAAQTGPESVKAIVPGPFLRPRLVKALPCVVLGARGPCQLGSGGVGGRGIPDPWLEYLCSWECGTRRDLYLRLTDLIWKQERLALVQGIPDPWKAEDYFDKFCRYYKCCALPAKEAAVKKKPKRKKSRKVEKFKNSSPNDFQKLRDRLEQLDTELKLKAAEGRKESTMGKVMPLCPGKCAFGINKESVTSDSCGCPTDNATDDKINMLRPSAAAVNFLNELKSRIKIRERALDETWAGLRAQQEKIYQRDNAERMKAVDSTRKKNKPAR